MLNFHDEHVLWSQNTFIYGAVLTPATTTATPKNALAFGSQRGYDSFPLVPGTQGPKGQWLLNNAVILQTVTVKGQVLTAP